MAMIDFNSSRAPSLSASEKINALIDAGLEGQTREGRTYLGASAIGGECERAIQLDYLDANGKAPARPGKDFTGKTLRTFAAGHSFEELAIGWLRAAGFNLRTRGRDGKQFGFSTGGERFRGHCDGVILGGPDAIATPALWEHKALGNKSWQEVVKKGVTKARPGYAAQLALYQGYLELADNPALFTATNRDTLELYHELVPFDGALAQAMSDRAVRVLQASDAGELIPREFAEENFVCRWCRWREFCWGAEG